MTQWISVKERLPRLNQEVLVALPHVKHDFEGNEYPSCGIQVAHLLPVPEGASWNIHVEDKWVTHITHWMPFPEPPKDWMQYLKISVKEDK